MDNQKNIDGVSRLAACAPGSEFFVFPRIAVRELSEEFQGRMADLIEEFDKSFLQQPENWVLKIELEIDGLPAQWPVRAERFSDIARPKQGLR